MSVGLDDVRPAPLNSCFRSRLGCKVCRMASYEGSSGVGKQRQYDQVLGPSNSDRSVHLVRHTIFFGKKRLTVDHRHYHKNTVQALAWSPNGDLVASASRDQTVRVFDIRAMKELRLLKGHKKEVCCRFNASRRF